MTELPKEYIRCVSDPWYFLTECCFTRDQVDKQTPVKKFPAEWEYLRLYVEMWKANRLMAVPKSRRMFMSWANIGLYLWAALFNPGQDFAFVSKKEDDAGELIRRAEFIYDHIPPNIIPKGLLPKKSTRAKPAALIFEDIDSKIQGFPMGADQLRSFTFSGILGDESAFWEDAQKFYSAAIPTIEGGGRMTLISSRSPGFFQRIVYDQLDNTDYIDEEVTPHKQYPFKDDSVIIWRNPKNKFLIFDLHYTANPNKRSEGFAESVKNSMPIKDFMVEYERNWEAFDGRPVYEDYSKLRHESKIPLKPHLGLPLLCGWDFGLTPACVVAQLRDGTLFILREYVSQNKGIETFAPEVMLDLSQHYPEWNDQRRDFRHYIDPAGHQQAQTDQRTCAGVMAEKGLKNITSGPVDWETRRKSVEHFLLLHKKGGAGLQLYAPDAPTLSKGFAGGYQYPERYEKAEPGRPQAIKNQYSHPHDALQYLCGGAMGLLKKKQTVSNIPIPNYGNSDGEVMREKSPYAAKTNKRNYGERHG